MKRHRQKPNEEHNFWQPATDMMSGLVFVLVLIIALLGLYLLSDYTGYEEASSVSSEGPSSSGTGWNNNDPGGWYYDGGTGDGDGDGNGQFDQQIIQTGGGGGYGEDGIKTAVFVEVVDDETERRIPEAGVTFELYRTEFEIITALGMLWFAEEKCDIVVLEVGLGGTLDSTNVIDPPECAVITALGMDHVKELGPTIADIAAAKAGIIKPGSPVVSYGGVPKADAVIARVAKEQNAPLTVVDLSRLKVEGGDLDAVTFDFDGLDGVRLPLIGSYQPKNAALAITALRVLRGRGWNIPDSAIRTGLEQVSWPGRFELLRHSPAFLLDGSHNAHGMRATVQSLRDRFPGQKFVFLLSIMADKDVDEMLALLLPLAKRFVTVAAHTPRAMPAETLAEHIRARGGEAEAAADIPAGVARAVELGGDGPVCALGTLYFSGDVRQAFARLTAE